jgi:hypothetical protein
VGSVFRGGRWMVEDEQCLVILTVSLKREREREREREKRAYGIQAVLPHGSMSK